MTVDENFEIVHKALQSWHASSYPGLLKAVESLTAIQERLVGVEAARDGWKADAEQLRAALEAIIRRVALVSPHYEMARAALSVAPIASSPAISLTSSPGTHKSGVGITRHAESCASLNILTVSEGTLHTDPRPCDCGLEASIRKEWELGDYECRFEDFYRHWIAPRLSVEIPSDVRDELVRQMRGRACSVNTSATLSRLIESWADVLEGYGARQK